MEDSWLGEQQKGVFGSRMSCFFVCLCVVQAAVRGGGTVKCGSKSDRLIEADTAAPHNARASAQKMPRDAQPGNARRGVSPFGWLADCPTGVAWRCLAVGPFHSPSPDSRASPTKGQRVSVIERPLR